VLGDPLFYLAAIPAVILLGLAKGGFAGVGILGLPLLALVISPVQAAAILLPILLVQDVVSVGAFYRSRDDGVLRQMLPGAAIGILAGYLLAARVSVAMIELAVGLITLVFAVQRIRAGTNAMATPQRRDAGVLFGAASGFTSQIAHAGGPPFQLYVVPLQLDRDRFIGTSAVFFAVVNWLKVPAYAALGQFSAANMLAAAVLMPLAIVSTWAGVRLVRRVDAANFYRIIYALMLLVGGKLVWDGVAALI
jgi:uncharacterized membrane protein YfcA